MPVPNPTQNMSEIWDLFNYANVVTGNHTTNATTQELITAPSTYYFGDFMVFIVWIILFSVFNGQFIQNRALKALMVSSLIAFVWASLLSVVGLVGQFAVTLPVAVLGISVVVDKLSKDE